MLREEGTGVKPGDRGRKLYRVLQGDAKVLVGSLGPKVILHAEGSEAIIAKFDEAFDSRKSEQLTEQVDKRIFGSAE